MNGSHYIAWHHTSAFEIMRAAERIFREFPRLKLVMSHGGGAMLLQHNRIRSLFEAANRDYDAAVKKVFWDMAVYEQETMATMVRIAGAGSLMFATEMWGTANTIDPKTGKYFDDTLGMVKALGLSPEDERELLEAPPVTSTAAQRLTEDRGPHPRCISLAPIAMGEGGNAMGQRHRVEGPAAPQICRGARSASFAP